MNKRVKSEKYFRAFHLEIMLCSKLFPLGRKNKKLVPEITKYLLFCMYICILLYVHMYDVYTLSLTMLNAVTHIIYHQGKVEPF